MVLQEEAFNFSTILCSIPKHIEEQGIKDFPEQQKIHRIILFKTIQQAYIIPKQYTSLNFEK